MPLEITTQNLKATKIKAYLDTMLTIFDQDISLSDDDAEKIIQKIQHYDLSPILNFTSEHYTDYERYDQFIFCDLLLPTTNRGMNTASCTFTFLKSQIASVLEILNPLVESHQAIYILSELDAIDYDIHDTLSNIDINTLSYLAFEVLFQNDKVEANQKIDATEKHPVLQIYQAINTSSLINEIGNPGDFQQNFDNMPLLMPSLEKTFPHISQEMLIPIISYLQLIANNQNHLYLK